MSLASTRRVSRDHDGAVTGWHTRGTPARRGRAAAVAAALALTCALIGYEGDATACGACFASQSESTIVNDHRMALSISRDHTILWDQISYSGNPKEFAYVLPARPGTRLEPSKESWFASLDAATRPILMSSQTGGGGGGGYPGGGHGGGGYYDSEGGGTHGSGGCCSSAEATSADSRYAPGAAAGDPSYSNGGNSAPQSTREPVEVVEQNVVGPYETVTLHANEPGALQKWLTANGYAIPEIAGPIIEKYVEERFDFIALRLQPGKDVRSMEPIRIVSPGADPSLPLRLMQIGVGAKVGITLWVITEGRYHPKSFPDVTVDFSKLVWDYAQQRSNYQELSQKAMASGDGRGFLTEYADRPNLSFTGQLPQPGTIGNPGITDAYKTTCKVDPSQPPWQEGEAGAPFDGGAADAADDADEAPPGDDAGGDASVDDDGGAVVHPPPWTPKQCDDLDVALDGLHQNDVWITRLRANLPRAALDATLTLEPTAQQIRFENVHYATTNASFVPGARIAHTGPTGKHGTYALIVATAFFLTRMLGKRRRRSD